ncbi:hypothetical protein BC629DRAFT_150904 [Irpex lacteus]|nr:hypothetical protein BC629DRAFT_150904 [Irpex lacteus]
MPSAVCRGAARICGIMDMVEDITDDTQHELDSTLGVLFIGFMLSTVLYGLSTFQMHVYFTRYPRDGRRTKALVLLIWSDICRSALSGGQLTHTFLRVIDTTASTLISRMQYYYLIDRFAASFQELEITKYVRSHTYSLFLAHSWSSVLLAENVLAGLAVLIVHLFYAFRVWTVSHKSPTLSGIILATAVASFVFSIISTAKLTKQQFMAELLTPEIELMLGLTSGCSIISNLFIVGGQAYYLRPSRRPHIKSPTNLLSRAVFILATRGTAFTII